MNKALYAIYDRVAGECIAMQMYILMAFRTDQQAARYFADAINDESSMLHKHPGDYDLILLGTLSPGGEITPEPTGKRHIINGEALIAVQAPTLVKEA